ncbi:DivIVA domain-containing protein [Microtetraspora malaysiensis]|uniref:DivIVA domain-containing protein n=1 Tax=Microtetraspora malaysiensis TaxID=161358 RepID=UPI000B12EBA2|nr:DivIVA domain-containing protein [Microtetraspora malaysiensis]
MNRFPRVRGVRLGYDPGQVDELVRRIEGTLGRTDLDGPPISADEIRSAVFRVKRGGYNETAVDFALDAFIVAVEALSGRPAHSDGADRSGDPETRPDRPSSDPALAGTEAASTDPVPAETDPVPAETEPVSVETAPVVAETTPVPVETEPVSTETEPGDAGAVGGASPVDTTADVASSDVVSSDAAAADGEIPEAIPAAPGDGDFALQVERVERVAFRPGRLGMGYVEDEVDAFLDRVVATLRGTADRPVTAEEIRKATFATVVFKTGYAIADVDAFLAEIAGVLDQR